MCVCVGVWVCVSCKGLVNTLPLQHAWHIDLTIAWTIWQPISFPPRLLVSLCLLPSNQANTTNLNSLCLLPSNQANTATNYI